KRYEESLYSWDFWFQSLLTLSMRKKFARFFESGFINTNPKRQRGLAGLDYTSRLVSLARHRQLSSGHTVRRCRASLARSRLESGQPEHGAENGGDPKTHDDFVLRPAEQLKMMVQRGAAKDPPLRPTMKSDLQNDAQRFDDKHTADNRQQQL